MSFEWISWLVWTGLSLCGCLVSNTSAEVFALALGGAAFVVVCLHMTGVLVEPWRENK